LDGGFPLEFLFLGGMDMFALRLLLITGLLLAAPIASVSAQEASAQSATIRVDGLSCPFCTYGLEKHLKKVAGVEGVDINMKSGEAIVRLKSGVQVNDAELKKAVKKAGFTARSITRK
jgi:mercuric ion binding protein